MLTLSKLLVAAAIVAAVLTPVNASPSKVKREDECQAKCSKDYAENGGDIKLDLCEAGCGGEDATRDVIVGKLQDSINTLANKDDKTEYNAAVLELNSLCSDYDICSEWECFRDGVANGETPGIADLGDFAASTGLFKSCADCSGKWNGAVEDCAGVCQGTAVVDCAGVCKGTAVVDCAGTCQGTAVDDCAGVCKGTAVVDCEGACEGTAVVDCEGACQGTAVEDCAGTCQGDAVADVCKVCGGNSTEISACPTVTTITAKVVTQQKINGSQGCFDCTTCSTITCDVINTACGGACFNNPDCGTAQVGNPDTGRVAGNTECLCGAYGKPDCDEESGENMSASAATATASLAVAAAAAAAMLF